MLRVKLNIPRAEVTRAFDHVQNILSGVSAETRVTMRDARNDHVERRFETRVWAPHAEATKKMRMRRTGYYRRAPVILNKVGIWTSELLRSTLGVGPNASDEDTLRGVSLTIRGKVARIFHGGGKHQPRRPLVDEAKLKAELTKKLKAQVFVTVKESQRG